MIPARIFPIVLLILQESYSWDITRTIHQGFVFEERIRCNCSFRVKPREEGKVDKYLSFISNVHCENNELIIEGMPLSSDQDQLLELNLGKADETGGASHVKILFKIIAEPPMLEGSPLVPAAHAQVRCTDSHHPRPLKLRATRLSDQINFPLQWMHVTKPSSTNENCTLDLMVPEAYLQHPDTMNSTILTALGTCVSGVDVDIEDEEAEERLVCEPTAEFPRSETTPGGTPPSSSARRDSHDVETSTTPVPSFSTATASTESTQTSESSSEVVVSTSTPLEEVALRSATAPSIPSMTPSTTTQSTSGDDAVTSGIPGDTTTASPPMPDLFAPQFSTPIQSGKSMTTEATVIIPSTSIAPTTTRSTVTENVIVSGSEDVSSADHGDDDPESEIDERILETPESSVIDSTETPVEQSTHPVNIESARADDRASELLDEGTFSNSLLSNDAEPLITRGDGRGPVLPITFLLVILSVAVVGALNYARRRAISKSFTLSRPRQNLLTDVLATNPTNPNDPYYPVHDE